MTSEKAVFTGWVCAVTPTPAPTYSIPAGEEIRDLCFFSTFRRLRAYIQSIPIPDTLRHSLRILPPLRTISDITLYDRGPGYSTVVEFMRTRINRRAAIIIKSGPRSYEFIHGGGGGGTCPECSAPPPRIRRWYLMKKFTLRVPRGT